MTTPMPVCGWDPGGCTCDELDQLPPEDRDAVNAWAAWLLWKATGERYGGCPVTLSPCHPCSCGGRCEIRLPGQVGEIVAVTFDGIPNDPTIAVRVYDRKRVVRIDGGHWPSCREGCGCEYPDLADWSITYTTGLPVPPGGNEVAGRLACELAKACVGSSDCKLPRRTTTISRQGVTLGFLDQFEGLVDGKFGIYEIDSWVAMANRAAPGLRITSPDVREIPVQTWPTPTYVPFP